MDLITVYAADGALLVGFGPGRAYRLRHCGGGVITFKQAEDPVETPRTELSAGDGIETMVGNIEVTCHGSDRTEITTLPASGSAKLLLTPLDYGESPSVLG
jgi:hypothetical protein